MHNELTVGIYISQVGQFSQTSNPRRYWAVQIGTLDHSAN